MRKKSGDEGMHDAIIIGAGPAGIAASIYCARQALKTLVITKNVGGQLLLTWDIENYIGYQFITGPELVQKFEEHMRNFKNIELREDEAVKALAKDGDSFKVKTDKSEYEGKTVIVASGRRPRELGVPGSKELTGKGLSYCATCDGPLFRGKDVAVLGGGNSALEAILQLAKIARNVYSLTLESKFGGEQVLVEKVRSKKNVEFFTNANTTEILGEKSVSGMKLQQNGKEKQLSVQGVFVEIGSVPNSEFAPALSRNEAGEITVDCANVTALPGLFAAGDVTNVQHKQIIVAAGEGAKAAMNASRYLSLHE